MTSASHVTSAVIYKISCIWLKTYFVAKYFFTGAYNYISDSDVCIFELADRNESDDGTVGFMKESAEVGKEQACERPAPASDFQGQIVFF